MTYTIRDYRNAINGLNSYEIGSPAFKHAVIKVIDLTDAILGQHDKHAIYVANELNSELWTLDEILRDETNPEARKSIMDAMADNRWLLAINGYRIDIDNEDYAD